VGQGAGQAGVDTQDTATEIYCDDLPDPAEEAERAQQQALFAAQVKAMKVPSLQYMFQVLTELLVDKERDPFTLSVMEERDAAAMSEDPKHSLDSLCSLSDLKTTNRLVEFYEFGAYWLPRCQGLSAPPTFLNRVFSYLTQGNLKELEQHDYDAKAGKTRREKLLLSLLQSSSIDSYDNDVLIRKAKQANFFQVCVELYKKKRDFVKVLDSYVKASKEDRDAIVPAFQYLTDLMHDSSLPAKHQQTIRESVLSRLPDLVSANSDKAARLIVECFSKEVDSILKHLGAFKQLQFEFIRSIMKSRDPAYRIARDDNNPDEEDLADLMARHGVTLSPELHELYIPLLCEFRPNEVFTHLSSHHDYHIDNMLKLCQQYQINDASAYLLERTGDTQAALELTLATVNDKVTDLKTHISQNWLLIARNNDTIGPDAVAPVQNIIEVAVLLCKRAAESEKLWFDLMDHFVALQRDVKSRKLQANDIDHKVYQLLETYLYSFLRTVLEAMMEHVPLPTILSKITTDHQGDEFREFRDTIQAMMDTYSYEQNILNTATNLLAKDIFVSIRSLHLKAAKSITVRSESCCTCNRSLIGDAAVTLFDCGHAFHEACQARNAASCPVCQRVEANKNRKGVNSKRNSTKVEGEAAAAASSGPVGNQDQSAKAREIRNRIRLAEKKIYSTSGFNSFTRLSRFEQSKAARKMRARVRAELAPKLRRTPVPNTRGPSASVAVDA